jgi:hypothetical protein
MPIAKEKALNFLYDRRTQQLAENILKGHIHKTQLLSDIEVKVDSGSVDVSDGSCYVSYPENASRGSISKPYCRELKFSRSFERKEIKPSEENLIIIHVDLKKSDVEVDPFVPFTSKQDTILRSLLKDYSLELTDDYKKKLRFLKTGISE